MSHFVFWPLTPEAERQAARLHAEIAALTMRRAGWRLAGLLAKANFDPGQPRVPAGEPDGGQWTGGGDVRVAANDRSGTAPSASLETRFLPEKLPPNADVDDNIQEAESVRALLSPGEAILWFYSKVHNGAAWDYKQSGREYADFGNFNYGATGAALGFSDATLLRMAGWAQTRSGNSGSGTSLGLLNSLLGFGGQAPFGDDPADQVWIKRGIQYYKEKAR